MAAVTLLSARDLSRSFGGIRAVRHVDFDLPQGQVRALIGPNGAGKSTFVNLLCGRTAADSGTVTFDGTDITALPAHRRIALGIGYTFQITSIFPRLNAGQNVALALARHGNADEEAVSALMARVGLAGRESETAGTLSYGHQRLLEIAMGLAQQPKLLILDEPTQGLADSEIAEFIALVRDVSKGATILLIEHNMNVVMELAEFITVMNNGEVLAEGAPEAIRANADVQAAYLGTS